MANARLSKESSHTIRPNLLKDLIEPQMAYNPILKDDKNIERSFAVPAAESSAI
jgi:hypothetical protein